MPTRRRLLGMWAGLALLQGAVARGSAQGRGRPLVVLAAASLKDVLDQILAGWRPTGDASVIATYAGSGAIARQLEQGAPADILITADGEWMDWAEQRRLVRPATRVALAGNRLVLIAPSGSPLALEIGTGTGAGTGTGVDLAGALGGGRLALGNTRSVPAGRYAKAALERLGAWPQLAGRLAETDNVRAALVLVARGEAPLGIVYRSDALAEPRVRIVATFPEDTHPRIVYPVALAKDAVPAAEALYAFLVGPEARRLLEAAGFQPPPGPVGR